MAKRGNFASPPTAAVSPPAVSAKSAPKTSTSPVPLNADALAAAESSNRFGSALYQQLAAKPGNLIFSPAQMGSGLALLTGAATSETRAEMERVLQATLPEGRLQAAYGQLIKDLRSQHEGCTLHVVNRLWVQEGFPIEPEFLRMVQQDYESAVGSLDFAKADRAREIINEWAAKETDGRIHELFPPGILQETTKFVVAGAIAFKGTWKTRFLETDTHDAPFHTNGVDVASVPTMHSTGNQWYTATPDVQILKLPYVGDRFSMLILLPRQVEGLAALEQSFTVERLNEWRQALSDEDEIVIHLPKFTFTAGSTLKNQLSALGMPRAFSKNAEFARLTSGRAQRLDEVLFEAFIEVNEEGTEAAASWGGAYGNLPGPVPQTYDFNADHPFLFLIQDDRSGLIVFMGRVADPR